MDRFGGRDQVIRILSVAVVTGIAVWIVTDAVLYVVVAGIVRSFVPGWTSWISWFQVGSHVAYDVWLGSLALLLLIWLSERLSNSPPPDPPEPN